MALGVVIVWIGVTRSSAVDVAFGAVLLTMPLLTYALLWVSLRGIRLQRLAPPSVFEGDTAEVQLILRNTSRLPIFYPEAFEIFTPEVHEQKRVLFPDRVMPGETVVSGYRGACVLPRGEYGLGPAAIAVSDPFGWFQLRLHVPGRETIKVYPKFDSFGLLNRSSNHGSSPQQDHARFGIGESTEFFSVREYRRGDPLRRIHWGLTAHRGFPVVREYVRPTTGSLRIYLDLYRYALVGVGRSSSLEHAVRIAASLAAESLRQGNRVRVEGKGKGKELLQAATETGSGSLQAILDLLVRVKPNGDVPYDDFLASRSSDVMTGSTVVLVVSSYLDQSATFLDHVKSFLRSNCRVVAAIFDDTTFRNIYETQNPGLDASQRIAQRLRILGAETVEITCAANLQEAFRTPSRGLA